MGETDATAEAADHDEKNISYVYVGFNDGMKIEHHKLSYNELVSFIKKIQPLCFPMGELRSFEQARDLTIDLLKKWLVDYKFKNWNNHHDGRPVTPKEKEKRAEDIARDLSDNKRWKSHGKGITISELTALKLRIEDFSGDVNLRPLIRDYYNTMDEYVRMRNITLFIHNRVLL